MSHETIYKALYIQGRGALRTELARHLRSRRGQLREGIPDLVEISQRPPQVEDRAVPGHWESDLLMGKDNKSAIGTLVERKTRFIMLLHLGGGRTAEQVRGALTKKIQELPKHLHRCLASEGEKEMSQRAQFAVDTSVRIFFCDPDSPWLPGSNENTNGLLRQYFPKDESVRKYTAEYLDFVANQLNGRPRETLGWKNPGEALNELLR